MNNGGCDANAVCTDTPNGPSCTCNPGFLGNGKTCGAIVATLLDVDFSPATTKVGPAVVATSANDVWNAVGQGFSMDFVVSGLLWADGSAANVSMHAINLPGNWGMTSALGDPMYNGYIYSWSGTSASVTAVGLPAGTYDVYLFGHADADNANSGFSVSVHPDEASAAITTTAMKYTTTASDWNSTSWKDGSQFVTHKGVVVAAGQVLRVNVANGASGSGNGGCLINGMQLVKN